MKRLCQLTCFVLLSTAIYVPSPAWTDLDEPLHDLSLSDSVLSGQQTTENILSGQIATPSFTPQPRLIISEVFFDGSDERFEITNVGSGTFSGQLTVEGVKSSTLLLPSVFLGSGEIRVRGDTMSNIYPKSFIYASGLGLSISDTSALQVKLFSSGILVDTFSVDATTVSSLANNYGFEKVGTNQQFIIVPTTGERTMHISGSLVASPGYLWTLEESSSILTGSSSSQGTGQLLIEDEKVTGLSTTGTLSGVVAISEIHAPSDLLPEYIELYFSQGFSGTLRVNGLGSAGAAKQISLYCFPGQYIVISDSLSGFIDTSPVFLVDSVSLTDGGELLQLTDLTGNLYATAIFTGSSANKSWYISDSKEFVIANYPSPGFSEKAFAYFSVPPLSSSVLPSSQSDLPKESYYHSLYKKRKERYYFLKSSISAFGLSVNTAGMVYRKGNQTIAELVDGSEEFENTHPDILLPLLRIVSVLPDALGKDEGEEQISISLVSDQPVDLQDITVHAGSKKNALTGILQSSGETKTFKGTFGFTNKPSCITLEKGNDIYDTFCYGQPTQGIRIGTTGNLLDEGSLTGDNRDWIKNLHLAALTGQVCAFLGNISFDCISVKTNEKKLLQYEKKMASLQAKFAKKAQQYTGLQERYQKTKNELDMKRRKYYNQLKSVRAKNKIQLGDAKLTTKIWKDYSKLLQADLKKNREVVWKNSDIAFINTILESNLLALSGDMDRITLHGQTFKVGDIRKQYAFAADPALRVDMRFGQGLSYFYPEKASIWENWLEKRYAEEQ